jgi:hypothetical protein
MEGYYNIRHDLCPTVRILHIPKTGKCRFKLILTCKERKNTIVTNNQPTKKLVTKDEGSLHPSETIDEYMEPTQVNEEEPIPPFNNPQMINNQSARSKYRRELKPTKKYTEYIQQLTAKVIMREDSVKYHEEDKTQFLNNPIILARKSSTDMDTLYFHEALKAPDSKKFREVMLEEIEQHIQRKEWTSVIKIDVPENVTVLAAVWLMRQKRRIYNQEVYKWKK